MLPGERAFVAGAAAFYQESRKTPADKQDYHAAMLCSKVWGRKPEPEEVSPKAVIGTAPFSTSTR